MDREMRKEKKGYLPPSIKRVSVAMEGGVCAASDVIKKDDTASGTVSITNQVLGNDGFEFSFDAFDETGN